MTDESVHTPGARRRPANGPATDSTVNLARRLLDEITTLLRQEIALASTEFTRNISAAKAGVGSIATGGAVLFAGALLLLEAAVFALARRIPGWAAALIVGLIVSIIGLVMLQAGKKRLEPGALAPRKTQEALQRDKKLLERNT